VKIIFHKNDTMIIKQRMTAKMNDSFVVFLIGMRINKFWKFHKWFPVAKAMPKMIKELMAHKEMGFITAESWFGRTTIMVQYWESFEKLEAYAKNKDANHFPAWQHFNRHIKSNGDVGIWHETYLVQKGGYECVYNNMPTFGLGKAGELIPAVGNYHNAKDRIKENT
jgi:Monooxygenase af470-like